MEKIYEQSKDLHVRNVVFYGKKADHKIYTEAAFTNQVTQVELEDAFSKGLVLVSYGGKLVEANDCTNNMVTIIVLEGSETAEDYDSSETYAVGDYAIHESAIYKCNTASTTGTWADAKWDLANIAVMVSFAAKATVTE